MGRSKKQTHGVDLDEYGDPKILRRDVCIGQNVTFRPHCALSASLLHLPGGEIALEFVTGRVSYINREHGFYQVDYRVFGARFAECFRFHPSPPIQGWNIYDKMLRKERMTGHRGKRA